MIKTNSKLENIISLNKENYEISLLKELSHEIMNFRDNFKSKIKYTYILSPWASSMFGFEIYEDKAYIGVPDILYDFFATIKIYLINYIQNEPCFFIIFDFGKDDKRHPVALRVYLRNERVKCLAKFNEVIFIKMDEHGNATPDYYEDEFTLQVKEVDGLDWESFGE